MPYVFLVACALACPAGMGVMMWLMMRGTGNEDRNVGNRRDLNAHLFPIPGVNSLDIQGDVPHAGCEVRRGEREVYNHELLGEPETRKMDETDAASERESVP